MKVLAQAQALAPDQFAQDEAALVARVVAAPPKDVPRVLAAWKRQADPVGAEAEAERLFGQRALYLSPGWLGMVHLSGDLDPESGLTVLTALQSLAEPAALDPQDTRTPAQCQADALVEVCRRYLQGDGNGSRRRPQVMVTVGWDTLQTGQGIIDTQAGPMGAESVRRIACDATVTRVLLDPESVPIELGRATRVVPESLRRLLEARDQHCTHPGCDMPTRWCDAHHIQHWADGGKPELANLQLLCRRHHRTAHHHQPYPQRR